MPEDKMLENKMSENGKPDKMPDNLTRALTLTSSGPFISLFTHTHTHTLSLSLYTRVYQNLAISSENYRTFPKVGPYYKQKACKFLARSDYSLRPNSCVLFKIFVARRKISTGSNMDT